MNKSVEQEVSSLTTITLTELRQKWEKIFGFKAPPFCRKYLTRRLAYRLQEIAFGELSRQAVKKLDQLASQLKEGKKISNSKLPRTGTKLIREYKGETHEVLVTEVGLIYKGQPYTSLSAVANKITGGHRSGVAFFKEKI